MKTKIELIVREKLFLTVTFMTLFVVLSLQSPCSAMVCGNNGKCVALYKENSYVCLCKEGFTGRNCETGKIVSYGGDPRLISRE